MSFLIKYDELLRKYNESLEVASAKALQSNLIVNLYIIKNI